VRQPPLEMVAGLLGRAADTAVTWEPLVMAVDVFVTSSPS
jgi:hypothetical protein